MTEARLVFGNLQASGYEQAAGASPIAMNVLVEPSGTVRRRPGLKASNVAPAAAVASSAISLLHVTLDGRVYALDENPTGRHVYRVTAGGSLDLSGGDAVRAVPGVAHPTSTETEMLVVFAAGREMEKLELASDTLSRLGGTPPKASHVTSNASRLLANDTVVDRTKVRYSDIAQGTVTFAGHEIWAPGSGTAGFFTAEARPDPVVALGDSANEVLVFGSRTCQVYGSDETFVFAPVATIEIGCGAPYSVVRVDDTFYFMDDKRRIVSVTGRSYEVLSDPIRRTLEEMSSVADCVGQRVLIGPFDLLLWTFPSDGRTFVYQKGSGWSQWASYGSGNWRPCDVTAVAAHPGGELLAGTSTGQVMALALNAAKDASGANVRAYVETGYESHKTDARKHCRSVRFTLRRTQLDGIAQAFFGWRDEPGEWAARIPIAAAANDTELVVQFHSLGVYRRRQWFFEWSGDDELALVSAVENFQVMEE